MAATALVGGGVASVGQDAISQALSNLRNPGRSGKAEDPSRSNKSTENAAGTYRVLMPKAYRNYSMGPEPTPTPDRPTPTAIPEILPPEWPTEIRTAMSNIILPNNVHLIRSATSPDRQPNCVIACYLQTSYEVYLITPPLAPPLPGQPESFRMVYELGHAHQQKRREMEGKATWEETTEYQAFLVTRDKVNAILIQRGDAPWTQEPYHLFTNIWTGYIVGDPSFTNKPSNWRDFVINPYSDHLIDWKNYMDKWVRR